MRLSEAEVPLFQRTAAADVDEEALLEAAGEPFEAEAYGLGVGVNQHLLGGVVPEEGFGVAHYFVGGGCQHVDQFLGHCPEPLLELVDVRAAALVDAAGGAVEVVAQRLEAEGVPVLDQLVVRQLSREVRLDCLGLHLDHLVDFLEGGERWVVTKLLLLPRMVSTRCRTKALL